MAIGDLVDRPVYDSEEIYIKTFKEPKTRIRFAPASGMKQRPNGEWVEVYGVEAWNSELEHFHPVLKSVPCVEPHGELCGPCKDEDPGVRERSRKYYFNALDDQGEIHPYKMGVNMRDTLFSRESDEEGGAISQPLSQMEHVINRTGTGKSGTRYDANPQKHSPINWDGVELYDIVEILRKQAAKAKAFYFGDDDDEEVEVEAAPRHGKIPPAAPSKPIASGKPRVAGQVIPIQTKAAEPVLATGWGEAPSDEQIEAADTAAIKAWLDEMEVEYPSRAPRARLIEMAKEKATPPF